MAVKFSIPMRNALCQAWADQLGGGGSLRVFAGTLPANLASVPAGTDLLVSFTLGTLATWYVPPANGTIALDNLPLNGTASNTGTATYYRFYKADGTTCVEQGTVDDTAGAADALIDTTAITNGQNVRVTAFQKTAPGA